MKIKKHNNSSHFLKRNSNMRNVTTPHIHCLYKCVYSLYVYLLDVHMLELTKKNSFFFEKDGRSDVNCKFEIIVKLGPKNLYTHTQLHKFSVLLLAFSTHGVDS